MSSVKKNKRDRRVVLYRKIFKENGEVDWRSIEEQVSDFIQGVVSNHVRCDVIRKIEAVPWTLNRKKSDNLASKIVSELREIFNSKGKD